jgi:hypothetical protein
MNNNLKALIAAIVAALAAAAKYAFNFDIPPFILEIIMTLFTGLAALFLKAPEEKKS